MAVVRKKTIPTSIVVASEQLEKNLHQRLADAGLLTVPVNILAIAEFLGLEVIEEPMADDLSGYLEVRSGTWVVGVNSLHHRNRKRFTIAHEIAHYVLHSALQKSFHDQTFTRRNDTPNPMEREADRFAAQLLMPEDEVRKLIASGVTTLSGLATNFGVSALAMKYRVQNLGYQVNQ
ncbi:ImmA/IrrE family metallo-endopeptidase [Xanthomonas euvesicatoria]|uniref:ImmA/IrrE family metallo-endopeptidase n=1 Tax=Xanthomonas euvesicatoria TaxID=456327 RepID=UPI0009E08E6E|nr:ImmA/IrrE family metallo-endopeptidase [Xanthomonas euvesicatoria]MBV6795687.1 ImmA/IrrE family metallo-endopeptidase [Xanthomonas campestris pv. daturae]QTK49014.1 ImmA/IrrE family metallo-endopeptidase [Xanthomonas euvesicatoria pv. alfalfae]